MGRPKRLLHCDRVAYIHSHTIQEVTLDDEDRNLFIEVIKKYTEKNKYVEFYTTIHRDSFHSLVQFKKEIDCSLQPKVLKQEMTRAYNKRHKRKGTIWWDRYDDLTVIGEDQILKTQLFLACSQTCAGVVTRPQEEICSSFAAYTEGVEDGMTTLLPQYLALGDTPEEQQAAFEQLVREARRFVVCPCPVVCAVPPYGCYT